MTIKRYCVGHAVVIVTVGVDALSCFGDGRFFNCTEQNEIFEVYRAMSSHLSIMPGSSWKSFLAASSISLSPSTPTLFSTIILQSCTEVLLSKSMKFTTICLFFCSVFRDGEQNRIKCDLHFLHFHLALTLQIKHLQPTRVYLCVLDSSHVVLTATL